QTGWRPDRSVPIAGALTDSAYGPLTRVLMRKVAHRNLPDEPAREVVFTDWAALNSEVDALVREAVAHAATLLPAKPEVSTFRTAVEGAILAP
ncbi:MAG: hypothetical protein ACXWLG_00070, partial [Myxococcaceae bacterium]